LAGAAALFVTILPAQVPAGDTAICAAILDVAGQPLPNATLNVVNLLDGKERATQSTDSNGMVCIERLSEGLYSAEASLAGFMNAKYHPVRVVFPRRVHLTFCLPFAENMEGGIQREAILSGTLHGKTRPVSGVKLCLFGPADAVPVACTFTNDLGQYAVVLSPGVYRVELRRQLRIVGELKLDLSLPGVYRDRIRACDVKGSED
jgi:hypothetical protein